MQTKLNLSFNNRILFEKVSQAIFANPFSDERLKIDSKISGNSKNCSWDIILTEVLTIIQQRLNNLREKKQADINLYNNKDKELLKNSILFYIYHKYINQFDTLIQHQISAPDNSLTVYFYNDAACDLHYFGFTEIEIIRFFEIFFQFRRAFYFIKKSLTGICNPMKELRIKLWNNIFSKDIRFYFEHLWNKMEDFSTLLLGATGAGKGAAARAIGCSGYIPFNVTSLKLNKVSQKFLLKLIYPLIILILLNLNYSVIKKARLLVQLKRIMVYYHNAANMVLFF